MTQIDPPNRYTRVDSGDDTRERLLAAALSQFAQRGFYGASIAQIAGELDLTKQALLYYFKRKEDLYAEVLKRIAERLLTGMRAGVEPDASPEGQFEAMILGVYEAARANPDDVKVLMRELLEVHRSKANPDEWYLKTFLDDIVGRLDQIEGLAQRPFAEKFAGVFQILSAIEYFVAAGPTLTRFYGEEGVAEIEAAYPAQLREQVRHLTQCHGPH
ncbi:MAG: TetR/AcrR family transcriptional regulator [Pseudomonadota bacterium]